MERKRGASRKLADTTQKHFLPVISVSGDKAGILTPPRASSLGPSLIPQLWTGEGRSCLGNAPAGETKGQGRRDVAVSRVPSGQEVLESSDCERCRS